MRKRARLHVRASIDGVAFEKNNRRPESRCATELDVSSVLPLWLCFRGQREYGDSFEPLVLRPCSRFEVSLRQGSKKRLHRRLDSTTRRAAPLNLIELVSTDGGMSHMFRVPVSLSGDLHTGRGELAVR